MTSKFCIVHFMEEETVEVVPDFWISESDGTSQCHWPNTPFPGKNVVQRTIPHQDWSIHQCRILGTFDDFNTARLNLKDAEILSDFPSKNVQIPDKRLHKRNRRYISDDSSSDVNTKKKKTDSLRSFKASVHSDNASSSLSNDEEENRQKKLNVQIPKSFEDKYKRIQKATAACDAPTKKSATSSTKSLFLSPQNYRKVVDEGSSQNHSATEDFIHVSDNSLSNSSNDEEKENKRQKESKVQICETFENKYKAFEGKYNRLKKKIILTPCEASTKKSATSSIKSSFSSPQNYRKDIDKDDARPGCSTWDNTLQREQRAKSSNNKVKSQMSIYTGETEFEKRVIRDLTRIKHDVKEIRDITELIYEEKLRNEPDVSQRNVLNARQEELENFLPVFPLKTLNDWHEFETLLSNNAAAREQLEKMFSTRGGKNGAERIRRILRAVFSPCVATKISWQGLKKNEKFNGTFVSRALFISAKQHFNIDDRNVELTIINWFRRSSERIKNPEDNI
ncbi:uncharacterized protein LOC105829710 [Monomorium pharaonis]|uniref:uncharacterized protein LOC105829710 n=1 Tax=Monomorium pharaonis TaxID=307658 RepID=UPI0017478E70|nr:uncharacterized protein LOC105829710 [Monomorium pharaonis]